jgi:hypothetical protein
MGRRRGSRRERSAVTAASRGDYTRRTVGPDEAARGTRAFGFIFALRFAVGFSRTTGRSRRSEHRTSESVTESERVTRPAAFTLLSVRPVV